MILVGARVAPQLQVAATFRLRHTDWKMIEGMPSLQLH
jgi:hypothetical protein